MNLSEIFSPKNILRFMYPHTCGWKFTDNGVIGEKMSYNAPKAYWDALQHAGITHIIDVRYKYNPEKFEGQFRKHALKYYSYPVHNDPDTIASMVRNYCHFTDLLTDGGYFMMGRTHGLTAFAIYLSFSKKHGLYPMELRSYLKNNKRSWTRPFPSCVPLPRNGAMNMDPMGNTMKTSPMTGTVTSINSSNRNTQRSCHFPSWTSQGNTATVM